MTATRRLCLGGIVVIGATAYLAYLGASSSWQFYLTVDELVAGAPSYRDYRVRISGTVAHNSLRIAPDRTTASFVLQGATAELRVQCSGTIPDNLAEGMDVVVEGRLEGLDLVQGNKVLTRCASKYSSGE